MNISKSSMKKVLLTINNNRISGIEMFTLLLAENLDKNLYDVTIGIPIDGPITEYLNEHKINYYIFNNERTGKHSISGIKDLYNFIKKNKFDIIHAQAGVVPCVIGKILSIPLLIEHKHGLDFTADAINNMSFQKLQYEKLKKYFSDYTVTVCNGDRNILIKKFGFKEEKVITVYNGIKNSILTGINNISGKKIIGTVGRLTYQKGHEYFIEAAKNLVKEGFDFEFHIYGDGEKKKEFEKLIIDYGLEKSVFLKGYSKDVLSVLRTFDLFVLTSRYEGIPYVLLEAMSMEVPIVTTDVGGISEVIRNNENGLLVENKNVSDICEKIKYIMSDNNLRKEIADKAKKDFEEKYLIENTVSQIEKIYLMN